MIRRQFGRRNEVIMLVEFAVDVIVSKDLNNKDETLKNLEENFSYFFRKKAEIPEAAVSLEREFHFRGLMLHGVGGLEPDRIDYFENSDGNWTPKISLKKIRVSHAQSAELIKAFTESGWSQLF